MSPKRVSEKTLELNICAEVLQHIRGMPGCQRAFWISMKQQQEAKLGIDELVSNVPAGLHLALQFKAPRPEPPDQIPYRFTINDRQNSNLLRLASIRPDAVYYIFPHYNTFTKMRLHSPTLLRDTWALKVVNLRGMPRSTNSMGTHVVNTDPPNALVLSEPMQLEIANITEVIEGLFSRDYPPLESRLISHTALKEWLYDLIREAQENTYVIGQRLRGFSTFCVS